MLLARTGHQNGTRQPDPECLGCFEVRIAFQQAETGHIDLAIGAECTKPYSTEVYVSASPSTYRPQTRWAGHTWLLMLTVSQSVSHTLIYITYLSPSPSLDVPFIKHNNTTRRTTRFVQESLVTVQIIAPALPYLAIYQPFSNIVLQALLAPGF